MTDAWLNLANAIKKLSYDDLHSFADALSEKFHAENAMDISAGYDERNRLIARLVNEIASEIIEADVGAK